jgi:GST-like protein
MTPLHLYTYATPNGHKASIMLEETALPYEVRLVDIEAGEQHQPGFLKLNPNNKIPVLVDPNRQRTVAESGAILFYLAERSGVLLPVDDIERSDTLSWALFQAAHVGPTLGQLWHFKHFARERLPAAIDRFEAEAQRVFGVLEARLSQAPYIAGSRYGIADIMTWPWIRAGIEELGLHLDNRPRLADWHAAVAQRPAVQRGVRVPAIREHAA